MKRYRLKKWVKVVLLILGVTILLIIAYKILEKSYNDALDYCVNERGNSLEYCKKELMRYES